MLRLLCGLLAVAHFRPWTVKVFPGSEIWFSERSPRLLADQTRVHDFKWCHSSFLKFPRLIPRLINLSKVVTPHVFLQRFAGGVETRSLNKSNPW